MNLISISIARNQRERRLASFPYWNDDARNLMAKLQRKGMAAYCYVHESADIIAWTTHYYKHAA